MNKELEILAKYYVEHKDSITLTKIFKHLKNFLKKKADFVFYQREFHEGKIIGYKTIQPENKKIAIHEFNFKLSETKQTTLEDVQQDLALEVIRILNNYKLDQSFETYLIGSLWNYTPSFINRKFYSFLKHKASSFTDDEGNEKSLIDDIAQPDTQMIEDVCDMFENLTETEKKVIKIIVEFPEIKQSELAEAIGVTQQRVSQILRELRKKYSH